jgi:hypothetical protein
MLLPGKGMLAIGNDFREVLPPQSMVVEHDKRIVLFNPSWRSRLKTGGVPQNIAQKFPPIGFVLWYRHRRGDGCAACRRPEHRDVFPTAIAQIVNKQCRSLNSGAKPMYRWFYFSSASAAAVACAPGSHVLVLEHTRPVNHAVHPRRCQGTDAYQQSETQSFRPVVDDRGETTAPCTRQSRRKAQGKDLIIATDSGTARTRRRRNLSKKVSPPVIDRARPTVDGRCSRRSENRPRPDHRRESRYCGVAAA